jgi:hypothetical protein
MIPTKNTCNSGISSQTNQSRSFTNGEYRVLKRRLVNAPLEKPKKKSVSKK